MLIASHVHNYDTLFNEQNLHRQLNCNYLPLLVSITVNTHLMSFERTTVHVRYKQHDYTTISDLICRLMLHLRTRQLV